MNYMFAFRPLKPEPVYKPVYKLASEPAPNPVPKLAYNRFSINHLINYKSPGGCRSCN
jgi:hypothetical protein